MSSLPHKPARARDIPQQLEVCTHPDVRVNRLGPLLGKGDRSMKRHLMATAGPELEVTSFYPDESAGSGKEVTVISSCPLTSNAGDTCVRKAHYGGGLSSSPRFVGTSSSMEGTPEGHLLWDKHLRYAFSWDDLPFCSLPFGRLPAGWPTVGILTSFASHGMV